MLPPIIEVWLFDVSLAAGSELQLPDLFRTELPPPFLWCLSEGSSSAQAALALPVCLWVLVLPSHRWLLQHQCSL